MFAESPLDVSEADESLSDEFLPSDLDSLPEVGGISVQRLEFPRHERVNHLPDLHPVCIHLNIDICMT